MISEDLLNLIACPETKQDLVLADKELVEKINSMIDNGELVSKINQRVTKRIDGGLIQKDDKKLLYPIRDEIPILLIDEAIPLANLL